MSRLTRPLLFSSSEECEHAFYEALDSGDAAAGFEIGWDYARHRLTPPAGRHAQQHRQG